MPDSATRLPHRVRARIAKVSYPIDLRAKQRVVAEGEETLPLFVVSSGALTASITSANGERAIVAILGPGDVFGDTRLLPSAPPHPEIRALVRSRLLAIPPGALRRVLEVDESVTRWLLSHLLLRVRSYEHHLARLLPLGVAGRVEAILLDLAGHFGRPTPGGVLVRLPLTQGALAAMVGASRETVNRSVHQLVGQGRVLQSGRTYVIPTPPGEAREVTD